MNAMDALFCFFLFFFSHVELLKKLLIFSE